MYRLISISIFVLLTVTTALAQDVPKDPVLFSQLKMVDDKMYLGETPYNGEAYFLNTDGSPMAMRSYVDGKKEGVWRVWYQNGHLQKEGDVKDGEENGRYREYTENGQLIIEEQYLAGLKNGTWKTWRSNGTIASEKNFKNGLVHGKVVYYDEEGKEKMTEEYANGKTISTNRFQSSGGVTITRTTKPATKK